MSDDNYYNNKGQQDRSEGRYSPPSKWEEKVEYDRAWEVTKAQEDANEGKYRPPSGPGIISSKYDREKYYGEKESYDKSYDDTKSNNESQEKSSGCFITSACIEAFGLPDNCIELETLRKFRDEYILNLPQGNSLIKEYYNNAPNIVSAIDNNTKSNEIYNWIFQELIEKSLNKIESGDNLAALNNYKSIYAYLKHNYLTA